MNTLIELGLTFCTAFILGLSLHPVFIRLYTSKNIVDKRDVRKVHIKEVPTMGGVPIFISFLVTTFIWLSVSDLVVNRYFIGSLVFILFIGLRDDFVNLKPRAKLISQLVPAIVIFYFTDVRIISFYGFVSEANFPIWLSVLITSFSIIVITNSINLIDGLDGLAASISFVIMTALGTWLFLIDDFVFSMILFTMAGSILAFLLFNWQPAKIFMGDTGALILGFTISIATIRFLNVNYALPENSIYRFSGSIATAFAVLIIPLFDTLRVFILRIIKRKSPLQADKNHVHHILFRLGMTHRQVTLLLVGINLNFIILAIILRNLPDVILIPALLGVGLFLALLLDYLFIKKVLIKQKNDSRSVMEIIRSSREAS
jgi:UDP-GlcNAc:undecaprenyl-phosphate GlcNAc-1-phosphate transferase